MNSDTSKYSVNDKTTVASVSQTMFIVYWLQLSVKMGFSHELGKLFLCCRITGTLTH